MKFKILLIGSIVILLILSGCGVLTGGSGADLNGTNWTLESFGGQSLINNTAMTAEFDGGEIRGSASCNQYFGGYKINGNQISIEGLGWTEMACMDPEGIMEQEIAIMMLLSKSVSYQIEGGKLYIEVESGEELIFIPREN